MENSVETSGKTVEEAVELALQQLGLSREDVEIEVLAEGTRGRFGLGGEQARVLVRALGDTGAGSAAYRPSDEDEGADAPREYEEDAGPAREEQAPYDQEVVDEAVTILGELLRLIDIEADVTYRIPETAGDGLGQAMAVLDVQGDDLGLLIGRRGETLAALQFMVNLILNKGGRIKTSISVDVEGYRRRREERLVSLARRAAAEAQATGEPVTLEPMPPNERRIIHVSLAEDGRVTTASQGGGISRRVTIMPRRR